MISEGSCDSEDWSNDADNSALSKYISKYIQTEKLNGKNIHNMTIFLDFLIE